LEKSVWHQVVADRPSHVAGQLGGVAFTDFLHRLGLLLLLQTGVLEAMRQTNRKHDRSTKEFGGSAGLWALSA
jgi:hypothetical protein